MLVGVLGLGLIGGSFAKAYTAAGHTVIASDTDNSVFEFAVLSGAVTGKMDSTNISSCDLILLCVYPNAAIEFLETFGPVIGKKPIVIDCCGTKRVIVDSGFAVAEKYGFVFIGGHPMAGTQYSGFKYAREDLFQEAPMVIVPPRFDDIVLLDYVKKLLMPAGFSGISVATADLHDQIIAFTSQLAHVVSNAYVKSPSARIHKGFSAGSYKDLTRVAWLNPDMWTELFMDNGDFLSREIGTLIDNLSEYKDAIDRKDYKKLQTLLTDGKLCKEEIDGNEKNNC